MGVPTDQSVLRIADVAEATGVAPATLRAWERRYGFPVPRRTDGGQRLYSAAQVAQIRRLTGLLHTGMRVSQAVEVLRGDPAGAPAPEPAHVGLHSEAARLHAALTQMRAPAAETILGEAAALFPLDRVIVELVEPVMRRIGTEWEAGELGVDQEHFASAWLRGWMDGIVRVLGTPTRERLLCACVEGERHDLGLSLMHLLLRRAGYDTVLLGADVPESALVAGVGRSRPDGVLLSVTREEGLPALRRAVAALLVNGSRSVPVAYGGRAAAVDRHVPGARWLGRDVRTAIDAIPGWLAARV